MDASLQGQMQNQINDLVEESIGLREQLAKADTESIDRLFLELSQFTKATTSKEDNLAMLVRRLLRRLEQLSPGEKLAAQADDYLRRMGLRGSPLRGDK